MDHKSWLWRKKSSEKAATDKANNTSKENEEVQALLAEKEELEKDLKRLNDKLASTISDNKLRDEQVKKQTKIAQEAVTGWEKAEAEMVSMKQYLEESMQQQIVYEERVSHLDGALKECMQQLRFVREEQEQRIQDAVMKVSKEFEQARLILEEQLSETTEELARSAVENAHLNKSILAKENLIEDLKRQLTQAEADHNGLMIKLEFAEKDNTSLKYEVRVLGKELEIRNEEIEFNRRTADASHKQHLESARKIAKLESECQRLRLLVRKRRITTLTEQLHAVQEENKTLKESLNRKASELQFSRSMLARTASKLLQLESQIEEFSKGQVALEQPRNINLMDDFIEMEKLATADFATSNHETCSGDIFEGNIPGWLHHVVKMILERNFVTHKTVDDITEDIKVALGCLNNSDQCEFHSSKTRGHFETTDKPQSSLVPQSDYMVRVLQWKTSELNNVLQRFLHLCYELLNGKADTENFVAELTTTLDWIMNHCFSLQDVSSIRDAVKKQFDWDETRSENEAEIRMTKKTIASLRLELQNLKESNKALEGQIQNETSISADVSFQFTEAELKEAHHKVLALEVELENKNHHCEELEARCIELQLQLESMTKECSKDDILQKDKPLQSDWEITAATEKLAECQETILNLGKQLKALASPNDASFFDNVTAVEHNTTTSIITVPPKGIKVKSRSSLLDQMLADNDTKLKVDKASDRSSSMTDFVQPLEKILVLNGLKGQDESSSVNSLAIVRAKKSGGRSLWKKLLGRKKKAKKKAHFLFNT
ncbi:hypothetical protein Ahy_Scaffold1g106934 isoform B [Arachis hypogaea]|uniref:Filament-like plant protein n=1 Tax=Arachis hypogaea TaxID=3818 RepID=A0A444WTI4_ARAHY|nr:hypothetical protein Ahy_Scaffold1g106934 isoform B [Arachis hypogaea]